MSGVGPGGHRNRPGRASAAVLLTILVPATGATARPSRAQADGPPPPVIGGTTTTDLIRNARVHVSRITHLPRQRVRMHYAPPMTIVFLTDAHFAWIWPDGRREEVSYKAGDAAWYPGGLHASESFDDHEQRLMAIVPVDDPYPARAEGDPFIGTFVAKPESRTGARSLSFSRGGDWQTETLRVTNADGVDRAFTYRAKFDDTDYPYTEPGNLPNTIGTNQRTTAWRPVIQTCCRKCSGGSSTPKKPSRPSNEDRRSSEMDSESSRGGFRLWV